MIIFINQLYKTQQGLCSITKIPLTYKTNTTVYVRDPYGLSLDRINSKKGYTQDNIQLLCNIINLMKNEYHQDIFIHLCKQTIKYVEN